MPTGALVLYQINFERILFQIDADHSMVTMKPFADISSCRNFSNKLEVFFMVGSIFHLTVQYLRVYKFHTDSIVSFF